MQEGDIGRIANRSLKEVRAVEATAAEPGSEAAKLLALLLPPKAYQGKPTRAHMSACLGLMQITECLSTKQMGCQAAKANITASQIPILEASTNE